MKIRTNILKWIVILVILYSMPLSMMAKKKIIKKKKPVYVFKVETKVKSTPVKNQYRTGTCWCFSTVSFLESELIRTGKDEVDLSEMFVVRNTYPLKAQNYIRLHGKANHSQGGLSHDVINQVRRYGIVPESVYSGMKIDEKRHNHGEMVSVLNGILDGVLKRRGRRVTPRWLEAYEAVLDVYLGKVPKSFQFKGKSYTPKSFSQDYMQLNYNDYIELTSYSHYPYYKKCRLEIPDNWNYAADFFNVPIDDLEKIVDNGIRNGYSFVFDGDVSEKDFSGGRSAIKYGSGYAIIPEKNYEDKTKVERKSKITRPVKEKEVTQELRQKTFNNFSTTDDHLMHVVGIAHDQTGAKFYLTKNSSGSDRAHKGYIYLSKAFFRLKTTAVMVHKNALPDEIKEKLGIK